MRRCCGVKRVFIKSRCRHGRLLELKGCLEMAKWNPSTGIRIEPRCSPTRTRIEMGPKGNPNGIQLEPNWNRNGIQRRFKWTPHGTQQSEWNPNGIQMEFKPFGPLGSIGGHCGSLGSTGVHWGRLASTGVDCCHWDPLGATEIHQELLEPFGVLGSIGGHWSSLGATAAHWRPLGGPLGSTGIHWEPLRSTWRHWCGLLPMGSIQATVGFLNQGLRASWLLQELGLHGHRSKS